MPGLVRVVVIAWTCAACGGSSAADATARASWRATARLVADGWRRDALPRRYAADTLRVAARQLNDPTVAAAADAVERGDRAAAVVAP